MDCNDTATCPVGRDEAVAPYDALVGANDGTSAIDSGTDATNDNAVATDSIVDSNDGALDTSPNGDANGDATDDTSDGGWGANDAAEAGPPPVDTGMNDADAGLDGLVESGPPPVRCKSSVLGLKAAIASSITDPNVAAQAIDKNFNTRWESAQGADPQWIYVDFGAPVFVNRVQILWLRACAANYDLQVSNNATTWMTIRLIVGNTTGSSTAPTDWSTAVDHAGLSGVGRYLRIFGKTRCETLYGYSLFELQVSGDTNTSCVP